MFAKQFWALSHKILAVVIVTSLFAIRAHAATETVIHSFGSANADGQKPFAGLTQHAGAFYGTTTGGGPRDAGTVFAVKLVNGVWKEKVLYAFTGADGDNPQSNVVFDQAGNLYGTTYYGGTGDCFSSGCGTVFELSPVNGTWTETVIYNFTGTTGGNDGASPTAGLIFDATGNLYGTTTQGGASDAGTVFKLTPAGGSWAETVLYNFAGMPDGAAPLGNLIFDRAGNLFGTTAAGGTYNHRNPFGDGTIFELSPNPDGSWTETVLHTLGAGADGASPEAGLIADPAGNLYGTALYGGGTPNGGHGTVFQLALSNGVWTESVISNFTVPGGGNFPQSAVILDQAGNVYGTASGGTGRNGVIFKLSLVNGAWTHTPFYTFPDTLSGIHPLGSPLMDKAGNLYGTTVTGGPGCGCHGVVYMLAP